MRVLLSLSPQVGVWPMTLSSRIRPLTILKRRAHPEKYVPKRISGLTGLTKHAPPSLPLKSPQVIAGAPVEASLKRRCVPLSCVPPMVKPASGEARVGRVQREAVELDERERFVE